MWLCCRAADSDRAPATSGSGHHQVISMRLERKLTIFDRHMHGIPGTEFSLQNQLRQRVLDFLLDGPLERARTINRIEPGLSNLLQANIRYHQTDIHLG